MVDITYPIAYVAGLASFFAPCVLPLLPAYVSFIGGVSVGELKAKGSARFRKKLLVSSGFYVLGFSAVFVLLGTAAGGFGAILRQYQLVIQRLGGLAILIFGLEFAGFIKLNLLSRQRPITLPAWADRLGETRAFVVGVVFATIWTPCIGAVLGSILALAAISSTALKGASLLFVYSLGISTPFLAVAMSLSASEKYLATFRKHTGLISRITGVLLIVLGTLLLTGSFKYVNSWFLAINF